MRSETVDKDNFKDIEWDENDFKYCTFEKFSQEGGVVSSDFVSCSFVDVEWYESLFTHSNFIDCRFVNCVFLGSTFADSRFVECTVTNCRFAEDNLGSGCRFPNTVAYGCSVEGGEGFNVKVGR